MLRRVYKVRLRLDRGWGTMCCLQRCGDGAQGALSHNKGEVYTACFIYDLPGGRGSYATEIHSDMVSVFIQFGFNSCWSGSHSLGGLLNSPSV